jgi:hypothetical protein
VDQYKRKLAAEKEAARKKAEAEAWEKTRAAQEAARKADASNIEATRAAAAAMEEAEAAQKLAMAAKNDTVRGLRTVHRWEYEDGQDEFFIAIPARRMALNWIATNDKPALSQFIDDYVAKHFKDKVIPGVNRITEKVAY